MRAFFYVYILVSQGNKTIIHPALRANLDQRLWNTIEAMPDTSKHGRGESDCGCVQIRSKARALKNI